MLIRETWALLGVRLERPATVKTLILAVVAYYSRISSTSPRAVQPCVVRTVLIGVRELQCMVLGYGHSGQSPLFPHALRAIQLQAATYNTENSKFLRCVLQQVRNKRRLDSVPRRAIIVVMPLLIIKADIRVWERSPQRLQTHVRNFGRPTTQVRLKTQVERL